MKCCEHCIHYKKDDETIGKCEKILMLIGYDSGLNEIYVPCRGFHCSEYTPVVYYDVDLAKGCG